MLINPAVSVIVESLGEDLYEVMYKVTTEKTLDQILLKDANEFCS